MYSKRSPEGGSGDPIWETSGVRGPIPGALRHSSDIELVMFSLVGCWGWGFARLGLLVAGAFARLRRLGLLVGSSVDWPHTKFVHSKFSLSTALRTMVSVVVLAQTFHGSWQAWSSAAGRCTEGDCFHMERVVCCLPFWSIDVIFPHTKMTCAGTLHLSSISVRVRRYMAVSLEISIIFS